MHHTGGCPTGPPKSEDPAMAAAGVELVVHLGLDEDGRPAGTVAVRDQPAARFTGWLNLMAELYQRVGQPTEARRRERR